MRSEGWLSLESVFPASDGAGLAWRRVTGARRAAARERYTHSRRAPSPWDENEGLLDISRWAARSVSRVAPLDEAGQHVPRWEGLPDSPRARMVVIQTRRDLLFV